MLATVKQIPNGIQELIVGASDPYSRILRANLSWSPTWTKFCQLIVCLSVVLAQLNLTKLKLEY